MRATIAAAAGATAAVLVMTLTSTNQSTPAPEVQVIERTVVLMSEDLDKQLNDECVAIVVRMSGDPEPGVRSLIDRHYDGQACDAAHEALRGNW
jgi:hypothetical protein